MASRVAIRRSLAVCQNVWALAILPCSMNASRRWGGTTPRSTRPTPGLRNRSSRSHIPTGPAAVLDVGGRRRSSRRETRRPWGTSSNSCRARRWVGVRAPSSVLYTRLKTRSRTRFTRRASTVAPGSQHLALDEAGGGCVEQQAGAVVAHPTAGIEVAKKAEPLGGVAGAVLVALMATNLGLVIPAGLALRGGQEPFRLQLHPSCVAREAVTPPGTSRGSAKRVPRKRTVVSCTVKARRSWALRTRRPMRPRSCSSRWRYRSSCSWFGSAW